MHLLSSTVMDVVMLARAVAIVSAPLLPGASKSPLPPLPPPQVMSQASTPAQGAVEDPCEAPFSYDVMGIKHYVLACLDRDRTSTNDAIPDCTVPYDVDAVGNHHYIDACLGAGDPCDVPFSFTADGIKRFSMQCLAREER
jgi:hypothetical protein